MPYRLFGSVKTHWSVVFWPSTTYWLGGAIIRSRSAAVGGGREGGGMMGCTAVWGEGGRGDDGVHSSVGGGREGG